MAELAGRYRGRCRPGTEGEEASGRRDRERVVGLRSRQNFYPYALALYGYSCTLPYMDRICSTCHVRKPLYEFARHRASERHYRCKACANTIKRARPASVKAAERKRWRQANPDQRAAHRTVLKAVRAGRLVRPELCESCHEPGDIQAHHDDYAKRLDVRWLCHTCHMDLHVQLRREARDARAA